MRATWDETWLTIADTIAKRSRCDSRQVGAVIVDFSNRPISMGYNGPPAAMRLSGTCGSWCPRQQTGERTASYDNCVTIHAETNALLFADRRDYDGGTIYVTSAICITCAKSIANSGLRRVVMRVTTDDAHRLPSEATRIMHEARMEVHVR